MGLRHPMLLVRSNGGAASVAQVADRPVSLILSGPGAAVRALNLVAEQTEDANLILMEIDGTSCDVVMMHQGDVALSDDLLIAGVSRRNPSNRRSYGRCVRQHDRHVDSGGMLNADVRRDITRVLIGNLDTIKAKQVDDGFADLDRQAMAVLANEGFEGDRTAAERAVDLRYRGQQLVDPRRRPDLTTAPRA